MSAGRPPDGADPQRRALLGALAVAVAWPPGTTAAAPSPPRATADRLRARPGAVLTLTCAGAESFLIEIPGHARGRVQAHRGVARLRAPWCSDTATPGDWVALVCTPLRAGEPCGEPVEIALLATAPRFGG